MSTKNDPPRLVSGRRLALALAVAAIAAIPYLNGLRNGFTFDDVALAAENPRLRSIGALGQTFTTDWWNGKRPQSLAYRPLTMATLAIDHAIARRGLTGPVPATLPARSAFPFHVQNLLWHAAASAVLFLLALEMFALPGLAFATAALFAVHPVHTETVDGIVGRAELMSACLSFLALLLAWRVVRDDPPARGRPLAAGVLAFLALLSKEQAIVLPAVPLLFLLLRTPDERRALSRRSSFRWLVGSLAVAALTYLSVRAAVLGSPVAAFSAAPGTVVVDNPIAGTTGAGRLLTPLSVFGLAARLIVYPRTLSADYSYAQIPVVTAPDAATALGGIALAGLLAAAFLLRFRQPAASFGIAFFLTSWLVTSNLPVVIGTIFGERLLYLPSAGACLAIACGLAVLGRKLGVPAFFPIAASVLVLLGGARTWDRNPDWTSSATLFASAAASSPRSCKALAGHATELFAAGRPAEAVLWAERALAIYPSYPVAHQALAKSLRALANDESDATRKAALRERANEHAVTLVELYTASAGGGSGLADAWNVLGSLALDRGDAAAALAAFGKSLDRDPAFVPSIVGDGVARAMSGDRDGALKRFHQALSIDPAHDEARRNAAQLESKDAASVANQHGLRATQLLRSRRWPEAVAEFREAARLQPAAARAYLGLGTALSGQADDEPDPARKRALVDEALRAFEHGLAVEPGNPEAHLNLAITYLNHRREPAKVVEHFRAYLRAVPDAPQRAQIETTIRQMEAEAAR